MDALRGPMFPAICRQFAHDTGENTLIPTPSLNESKHLIPLNVVTKRERKNKIGANKIEYTTYGYSLTDLLIDKPELESQVQESDFCLYNQMINCSLSGNIGAGMNGFLGIKLSASDKVVITCRLGKLIQRNIEDNKLENALKNRKLDVDTSFIKQMKDTKSVMCVVQSVITTLNTAEIKCRKKKGGYIEVEEKAAGIIDLNIGADMSNARNMVIPSRTTLAYQVMELKVDLDSGKLNPIVVKEYRG